MIRHLLSRDKRILSEKYQKIMINKIKNGLHGASVAFAISMAIWVLLFAYSMSGKDSEVIFRFSFVWWFTGFSFIGRVFFLKIKNKHILWLAVLTLWAYISFMVGIRFIDIIDNTFMDQVATNSGEMPTFGFFIVLAILFFPVIVLFFTPFLLTKLIISFSNRTKIRQWHSWAIFVYIVSTLALFGKAFLDVVSVALLFVYLFSGIALSHFLSYSYKDRINSVFYKYLEYIYVLAAIIGVLSATAPVEKLYTQRISELEYRLSEGQKAFDEEECSSSHIENLTCYDFFDKESITKELENLRKDKPQKIAVSLLVMGYILLTISLTIKLLKISGELFGWYRKKKHNK